MTSLSVARACRNAVEAWLHPAGVIDTHKSLWVREPAGWRLGMVLYTGTERWDLPKSLIIIHGTRRDLGGTLRERGRTRRATSDELSVYRRAMLPILAAVAELHRQWKTPLQDEEIRHILNVSWTGATSGLDAHGELVIAEYRRAAHNGFTII